MGKFKDLTGMKFGRLLVLSRAEDYINKHGKPLVRWNCLCDCGNKHVTYGSSLNSGLTKSCGCLQKEWARKNGKLCKKYNTYDLSGEYGIGYTEKGEEFYFDLEDYDKISSYYWRINNHGYVISYVDGCSTFYMLHNIIMKPDDNFLVDHINHNTLDNRKKNLRLATYSQNQMNLTVKSNNTSGVTGVSWDNTHKYWVARIQKEHNRITLGQFCNFDDAVRARKMAEKEYFGEFSYDNSINKEE